MNLLRLSEKDIRDYIDDAGIYHRGRMYFFNGFVEQMEETGRSITAKVRGSNEYTVQIAINSFQNIETQTCTCPYFREHKKPCKHIAAVLFETKRRLEYKYSKYRNSHKAVHAIFHRMDASTKLNSQGNHEQIYLYPTLFLSQYNKTIQASLEFRAGKNRSYVVKNAEEFIDAWVKGKRLVFGRFFTMDRTRQFFQGRDEAVIGILKDMYTTHQELMQYDGSYRYSGLMKGKQFQLMPSYLERFLDIMTGEAITASLFSNDLEIVPITEETMPVTFEVRQLDEWLSVKLNTQELPVELIKNSPYYAYQGKIYKIPIEQQKYISIIQEGFKEAGSNEMIIPMEYQGRFISEIVPLMKKTGDVMVNPSLKEQIVQAPLAVQIYLDQYHKGISARVQFQYGECLVNPAASDTSIIPSKGFILRDIEKEQPILDLMNQSGFSVDKDQFCLFDKGDIYRFVFEKLPELQTMGEVFYSEDFKKVTVKKSVSISSKVSLVDDILEISFNTEDLDPEEIRGILDSLRKKKKFFRLKDGVILPLEEYPGFQELAYLSDQLDISVKDMQDGRLQLPKYRAMVLDSLFSGSKTMKLEKEESFRQFVSHLSTMTEQVYPIPDSLKSILRDYQKTGYQWLKTLSRNGLGGILADDMGLGKTLQVLALVLSERESNQKPALVVAPTSLVYNWVMEAQKFTPLLKVLAVSGHQLQRQPMLEKLDEYDLVVTSYPLIRRDIESYQKYRFSYCFIDEAQHVKNHFTQSARAIRKISANTRFALTGTPMENSLVELWSLFDFIMPSYLFSQQKFQERFVKPIIHEGDKEAGKDLSRHIRPFILRRMKTDVLTELPEKIETTLTCELTEAQRKIYVALLTQAKQEIGSTIEHQGFEKSHIQILAALTRLRQICCHPSTFLENYEGGSGKLSLLLEILGDALDAGHRILLFSQFTSMLDIIQKNLKQMEIPYFYLSGQTPAAERGTMVSRFNEGEGKVFLLSLKAGGTGLTLTGADTVIHYDPWWNPAVEDQATDRAYRIGQEKVVQVFKLVTRSTIEEKILLLQEKKKEMIDMVIKPGETMLHKLSKEEIQQLFEL